MQQDIVFVRVSEHLVVVFARRDWPQG